MRYLGGKSRSAKYITDILRMERRRMLEETGEQVGYWEPFLGAAWVMIRMTELEPNFGSDAHYELMEMWKAVQNGWVPPDSITREEHKFARDNPDKIDPALRGFIGFAGSFGGKFFGGYAFAISTERNYAAEAQRGILKKLTKLRNVSLYQADFFETDPPMDNMLIYCDPPYAGTAGYKGTPDFNHDRFWERIRILSNNGHNIYISEYHAPEDFDIVWERAFTSDLKGDTKTTHKRYEKLYKYNGG